MYFTHKQDIMAEHKNSSSAASTVSAELYTKHLHFHTYLDKLVLSFEDLDMIDMLISVRQLNIRWMNSYSGLLGGNASADGTSRNDGHLDAHENSKAMWVIHNKLIQLIPLYSEVLHESGLSTVVKSMVSRNYDEIISMKEQMLHPLPERISLNEGPSFFAY